MPVNLTSRGNFKRSTRPYIRTAQSTLEEMKYNGSENAVKTLYEKVGGVVSANNLSDLPRDRRQADNFKS